MLKKSTNEIKHTAHSSYRCQYHIVFAPKFRRKEIYGQLKKDIGEIIKKYQTEHNSVNLQKLCVEIAEFCQKVYASTRNDDERNIYYSILGKVISQ